MQIHVSKFERLTRKPTKGVKQIFRAEVSNRFKLREGRWKWSTLRVGSPIQSLERIPARIRQCMQWSCSAAATTLFGLAENRGSPMSQVRRRHTLSRLMHTLVPPSIKSCTTPRNTQSPTVSVYVFRMYPTGRLFLSFLYYPAGCGTGIAGNSEADIFRCDATQSRHISMWCHTEICLLR